MPRKGALRAPAGPAPSGGEGPAAAAPRGLWRGARRLRWVLLALLLPLGLFGPGLVRGELFVSVLPVSLEPLRSEHPDEARAADARARWVTGDRLLPFLTDQEAIRAEILAGHAPLWEPLLGLGVPLYAGSLVALAYPPNWLAVALPPERAAGPLAVLSLAVAGLGLGLLLARLGLRPGAVVCGVAALELGGFGLVNLPYFMKVDAAAWIPWSLWAVEGLLAGRRRSGLALALALCASFLAGFVPIAVFGLALTAAWALVRSRAPRAPAPGAAPARPLAGLSTCAVFAALGLLGAAVQVLPTWEASRWSARQSGGEVAAQSLPAGVLWGTLVPDLFGGPAETTPAGGAPLAWWLTGPDELLKAEGWNALEWNAYALAGAVLLALAAVVATPRRAAFPALALALVLLFALGRAPARWLYALPGLGLGAPGRALALAWILWPWLAALGVEALLERRRRALAAFLGGAFLLALASFVLWSGLEPERWARALERTLLERYGERYHETLETLRARLPFERTVAAGAALRRGLSHTLGAAAAACAAGLCVGLGARGASRRARVLGALLVLACAALPPLATRAVDGWSALTAAACALGLALLAPRGDARAWPALATLLCAEGLLAAAPYARGLAPPASGVFPSSPSIEAVRRAAGDGRVLRYDASPSGTEEVQRLARQNLLSAYGIADLTPYLVFTPRGLFELVRALDPDMLSRRHVSHLADPARLDHPLLDLLRVTAVLSVRPLAHPRLEPVLERDGFCVYRRAGAWPAARVVRETLVPGSDAEGLELLAQGALDPARTLLLAPEHGALAGPPPEVGEGWKPGEVESVERPSRGRLDVTLWGSSGGWLVMPEEYAPGWRARVNGEEVPVLRADHALRAVRVPRGECRVETWYAPRSLEVGAALGALALGCAAWLALRRRPSPSDLATPG